MSMDPAPKRPGSITFLLVGLVPFAMAGTILVSGGCSGRRSDPVLMQTFQWQGGEVKVYDYCLHPGSYDCQVEWFGPNKAFVVLVNAGDYRPRITISNGRLRIVYRVRHVNDESTWRTVVYETPSRISNEFESTTSGPPPPDVQQLPEEKQ